MSKGRTRAIVLGVMRVHTITTSVPASSFSTRPVANFFSSLSARSSAVRWAFAWSLASSCLNRRCILLAKSIVPDSSEVAHHGPIMLYLSIKTPIQILASFRDPAPGVSMTVEVVGGGRVYVTAWAALEDIAEGPLSKPLLRNTRSSPG